jgi:hypothetical protein
MDLMEAGAPWRSNRQEKKFIRISSNGLVLPRGKGIGRKNVKTSSDFLRQENA